VPGEATPVRFPRITREQLDNGLRVWTIPYGAIPVATVTLVISRGTGDDPAHLHGLASLTGDLLDEGAGDLNAIGLAEAFARLGTQLDIDVGPDALTVSCSGLSRSLDRALELLASVVRHPRLEAPDFARVRELRVNRLRQLSRSAGTVADRAYVTALFGGHAYGHGALPVPVPRLPTPGSCSSIDPARRSRNCASGTWRPGGRPPTTTRSWS
jgi:zinc protease